MSERRDAEALNYGIDGQKPVLSAFKCYLLAFGSLGGYLGYLIISGSIKPATGYYLTHYLYTYDHGYLARGLVGEVIGWFVDIVTPQTTQIVNAILSVVLMIAAAMCIGLALHKTADNAELFRYVLFFSITLCILPTAFRNYFVDTKFDKLLIALTLFAVLLSEKKVGLVFAPLLCIMCVAINPVYVLFCMILIAIVLLQKFYESKYSVYNGAVCVVAYGAIIAMTLYGYISEKMMGFESVYEVVDFYYSRYSEPLNAETREWLVKECLFDFYQGDSLLDSIRLCIETYYIGWKMIPSMVLNTLFLALPLFALLGLFWRTAARAQDNRFQKFIFFLCTISPVLALPGVLVSAEASKYFGMIFMMQLCLIIYYVVHRNESVLFALRSAVGFFRSNKAVAVLLLVYFSLFLRIDLVMR